jgi:hypothetical protein
VTSWFRCSVKSCVAVRRGKRRGHHKKVKGKERKRKVDGRSCVYAQMFVLQGRTSFVCMYKCVLLRRHCGSSRTAPLRVLLCEA